MVMITKTTVLFGSTDGRYWFIARVKKIIFPRNVVCNTLKAYTVYSNAENARAL